MTIKQVTLRSVQTFSRKTNTATGKTGNACEITGRHLPPQNWASLLFSVAAVEQRQNEP